MSSLLGHRPIASRRPAVYFIITFRILRVPTRQKFTLAKLKQPSNPCMNTQTRSTRDSSRSHTQIVHLSNSHPGGSQTAPPSLSCAKDIITEVSPSKEIAAEKSKSELTCPINPPSALSRPPYSSSQPRYMSTNYHPVSSHSPLPHLVLRRHSCSGPRSIVLLVFV